MKNQRIEEHTSVSIPSFGLATAARCYYYQCFLPLLVVAFIVIITISWSFCFFTSTDLDCVCFLRRAAESCAEITNTLSARHHLAQFQLHVESRVGLEKNQTNPILIAVDFASYITLHKHTQCGRQTNERTPSHTNLQRIDALRSYTASSPSTTAFCQVFIRVQRFNACPATCILGIKFCAALWFRLSPLLSLPYAPFSLFLQL